jgi:hypothetical protein
MRGESSVTEPVVFYRMYAVTCVEIAAAVTDPARRASLFEMARAWFALAERAEKTPGVIPQQESRQD